jgi:orotidine-5'-phosphate decarboxylase
MSLRASATARGCVAPTTAPTDESPTSPTTSSPHSATSAATWCQSGRPSVSCRSWTSPPAFDEVCVYARRAGLLVIADGKRGDIGSTARAYADAYLEGEEPRADALTVNAYLGRESVEPFIAAARRSGTGIFVLVKTSNAGGDVQDLQLTDGRPLWHHVASLVAEWGEELVGEVGLSSVGAVVGATHPRAVADARRLMPQAILLLPGIGAQGGAVSDLSRAFQSGPASALVAASRSIDYAFRETGGDYREAAGAEAARLKKEIRAASGW